MSCAATVSQVLPSKPDTYPIQRRIYLPEQEEGCMDRFRPSSEGDRRYEEALRVFGPYEIPVLDRERSLTALELSRFAQAMAIARDRQRTGQTSNETRHEISEDVRRYVETQTQTKSSESVGAPFQNLVELQFDGQELLDQKGDCHRESLRTAALGAMAMARSDSSYGFYARRTVHDYKFVTDLNEMMRSAPVGSVQGLVSPCEVTEQRHAISIGMMPAREMAVVQYARKADPKTLEMITISLDRGRLDLLRQLLAGHGIEVPPDTKAEDILAYTFRSDAASTDAFKALIQGDIQAFDASLERETGKPMRQGQFKDADDGPESIPWSELARVIETQVTFEEALSWATMDRPQPLHPLIRAQAEAALQTTRPDGQPLLSEAEQEQIRRLLAADDVTIARIEDAEALLIMKNIQDTALDEVIRKYIAGDREIAMTVHVSGDISQVTLTDRRNGVVVTSHLQTVNLMQIAAEAAQGGRFASACGSLAVFGDNTSPSVFGASGMTSVVGMIMRGEDTSFLVANNAPLVMKYGKEKVHYGQCDCCDDWDELGPCSVCNTCDTLDRIEPGYVEKKKARKEIAAALTSA